MAPSCRFAAAGLVFTSILPAILAHSKEDFASMGPMGFMWPEDREWIDDENAMRGPCGSSSGPINRTVFPLSKAPPISASSTPLTTPANGALALEQKQAVFDVQVSISMTNDPSNASDFDILIPHNDIASLEYSHVCIGIPDIPQAATGSNATIRLQYVAEHIDPDHEHRKRHLPVNETFFACADVTLVDEGFNHDDIPCFNITADFSSQDNHGHSHGDVGEEEGSASASASSGPRLSSGDIAGIVIGSVVGVVVMGTALWYFIRRDKREKQMAQHMTATTAGRSKSISESLRQAPA